MSSARVEETVTTTVICGGTPVVALELGTGKDPDPVAVRDREKSPVRSSSVEVRASVVVPFDTTRTVVVELRDTGGGVTEGAIVVVALRVGTGRDLDPVAVLDREKSPVRSSSLEVRTSVVALFNTGSTVVVVLRDTGGGVTEGAIVVVVLRVGAGTDPEPDAVRDREKSPVRSSSLEVRIPVAVLFDTISTVVVELRDTGGGVTEAGTPVVALNVGTGIDSDAVGGREKSPVRSSSVEVRTSVVVPFDTTRIVVVEFKDTGGGVTEAGTSVVALKVGAGTDADAVGGREKSPVRSSSVELRASLEVTLVLVVLSTVSIVRVVVELRETGGGVAEAGTSVVALNVGAGTDSEAVPDREKSPVRLSSVELKISVGATAVLVEFSAVSTVAVIVEFKETGGKVAEGKTSVVALNVGAGAVSEAVKDLEKSPVRSSSVELRSSVGLALVLVAFSVVSTVSVMVEFTEAGGSVAEGGNSVVALEVNT